ncbi:hypothetical protein GB927_011430 [Shinella sp. CPCC 100929]|uniref:Uncharacterized protein n=1 Tax=Shinella lacus TaxID=2654216 RepID=A0ABT1R637_9HYPH|nr:hypothetical protein [Shinella lacus]MCQ4630654.1 hypothetical protein [Shinella lacus]
MFLFGASRKFITCCTAASRKDALHYFSLTEIKNRAENRPALYARKGQMRLVDGLVDQLVLADHRIAAGMQAKNGDRQAA